jgi:hypothetical protein
VTPTVSPWDALKASRQEENMTTTTHIRTRLTGWDLTINDSVRALLFGQLADLAFPVIQHYRSDLYHDARWIRDHVDGPGEFYFAVCDYGTSIGTDRYAVAQRGGHLYHVQLTRDDRGSWFAIIDEVSA